MILLLIAKNSTGKAFRYFMVIKPRTVGVKSNAADDLEQDVVPGRMLTPKALQVRLGFPNQVRNLVFWHAKLATDRTAARFDGEMTLVHGP
jgi:hypothetical protein